MTHPETADAKFYGQVQHILPYHETLLRDELRNRLFYSALERHVTNDSRVLDIGSGTGLWAIAAAKLGARKVTAIEGDEVMLPIIRAHARENAVADKVEVVFGHSLEVELAEKFDVIISETIGNEAFDEGIISTMIDARTRFLAPNGVIIPRKLSLCARPAILKTETPMPSAVPVSTECLSTTVLNLRRKISDKSQLEPLGGPAKLLEVDLEKVEQQPEPRTLAASWELDDISAANAVVLSAQAELTAGIHLDTFDSTSWPVWAYRFRPFGRGKGVLKFDLEFNSTPVRWSVADFSDQARASQALSPMFAYMKLKFERKTP